MRKIICLTCEYCDVCYSETPCVTCDDDDNYKKDESKIEEHTKNYEKWYEKRHTGGL